MADAAHQHMPATPTPVRPARLGIKLDTPANPRFDGAGAGVLSPVSQDGCFVFDRIIKAGNVSWKPMHLVLRPNCLSIYKDKDETKLRHQINLSEITAVARQRDSKKKMDHVFGIFSPARNYHLGASSDKEAQQWVDLIRAEARIDEDEGDMTVMSPTGNKTFSGFDRSKRGLITSNIASSSSEAEPRPSSSMAPDTMHSARRPSQALNYSGNERGSVSDFDFSDTGGLHASTTSLPQKVAQQKPNLSQQSNIGAIPVEDRVVCHGWLYVLKSKGGVRQWKKMWLVLRPKGLVFYKSDEEYSATHIIPFNSIIDAVDIDSVSRSKQYCMQVIAEEKNFRFCAPDENSLAKWLGAFKSLVRRKEAEQKRIVQFASPAGNTPRPVKAIASPQIQPPTPTPVQQPLS
ncbi:hypothetical protein DE146DRAFT_769805, partial [Phaeosphaeria sp. MPI-PUGE-AT-0046c]